MNISDILQPKTKEEIVNIICDKYNIPYSNEEVYKLINLHYMVQILRCNSYCCAHHYLIYKEEDIIVDENLRYKPREGQCDPRRPHQKTLNIEHKRKDIFINTIVRNWEEIYEEILDLIIKNSTNIYRINVDPPLKYSTDIVEKVSMASNLIACMSRYGPATFVIINSQKRKEKLNSIFGGTLKILKDINIGNRVIIGRKPLINQPGIFLFKYKKKYAINCIGEVKNNYISIPL